jgi:hypothetical protein
MTVRDQELGFAGEKNFYNLIFLFNTQIRVSTNPYM